MNRNIFQPDVNILLLILFLKNKTPTTKIDIFIVWSHYYKYLVTDNFNILDNKTLKPENYQFFLELVDFLKKNEYEFFKSSFNKSKTLVIDDDFYFFIAFLIETNIRYKKKIYNIYVKPASKDDYIFFVFFVFFFKIFFNSNLYKYARLETLENLDKTSTSNISDNQLNVIIQEIIKKFFKHIVEFSGDIWNDREVVFNSINLKILNSNFDDKIFRLKIFNKFFKFSFNFLMGFNELNNIGTLTQSKEKFNNKRTTPYLFVLNTINPLTAIFYTNVQNFFFLKIIFNYTYGVFLILNQIKLIKTMGRSETPFSGPLKTIHKKLTRIKFNLNKDYWYIINLSNNYLWREEGVFLKVTPRIYNSLRAQTLKKLSNIFKKNLHAYHEEFVKLNENPEKNFNELVDLTNYKNNNVVLVNNFYKNTNELNDNNLFLKNTFKLLFNYRILKDFKDKINFLKDCNRLYNEYNFAKTINKTIQIIFKNNLTVQIPIFYDFRLRIYPVNSLFSYAGHYLLKNLFNINNIEVEKLFFMWKTYSHNWSEVGYEPLFIKYFNNSDIKKIEKIFLILEFKNFPLELLDFNVKNYFFNLKNTKKTCINFSYFLFLNQFFWLISSLNKLHHAKKNFSYKDTYGIFINFIEKNEGYRFLIKNKFKKLNKFYLNMYKSLGRENYTWIKFNIELVKFLENFSFRSGVCAYLDSGANVFVQIAASLKLVGDELKKFNIIGDEHYFDIYEQLCDLLKVEIIRELSFKIDEGCGDNKGLKSFKDNINKYITREILKKIFMTFFYGSTTYKWLNHLSTEYRTVVGWGEISADARNQIKKTITICIKLVVTNIFKENIFKLMFKLTRNLSQTSWNYFEGDYHISNKYLKKKITRIKLKNKNYNIVFGNVVFSGDCDNRKIKKSILVNYIHSMDGLVAKLTILRCNYDVIPIHDCFGTSLCFLEFLKYDYNEAFYEAHIVANLKTTFPKTDTLPNNFNENSIWWVENKKKFLNANYNLI